jgi:preprotein translocase subunit SecY
MAEIHVQPKKNKLWWVWILVVLIILALAYFYYRGNNNQMGSPQAQLQGPGESITHVCAPGKYGRRTIFSHAIVKYIEEGNQVAVKVNYL